MTPQTKERATRRKIRYADDRYENGEVGDAGEAIDNLDATLAECGRGCPDECVKMDDKADYIVLADLARRIVPEKKSNQKITARVANRV